MGKKLLFPEDVERLVRRRYELHHRSWLAADGAWPFSVPLGRLTERDFAADVAGVRAWVEAWNGFAGDGTLRWLEFQWPRFGAQRLPSHFELATPLAVARMIREEERFQRARARYEQCVRTWSALGSSAVLPRHFETLADYSETDWSRLTALLSWLCAKPRSGYTLRQLPVEGLDTKWIDGRRRALVCDLLQAIRSDPPGGDFHEVCGVRALPVRARMRILCPALRKVTAGLGDLEAPIEELAGLALSPARCLIVENLESGLALPELDGCVAFVGLGNAVSLLSSIPWLASVPALYWGDLDTHGFVILQRARAVLGDVSSVLMDEETLLRCRRLWGEEAVQCQETELPGLTACEREVFEGLRRQRWGTKVRLEQERIPWSEALVALRRALAR
jgi:hypothetical protein